MTTVRAVSSLGDIMIRLKMINKKLVVSKYLLTYLESVEGGDAMLSTHVGNQS